MRFPDKKQGETNSYDEKIKEKGAAIIVEEAAKNIHGVGNVVSSGLTDVKCATERTNKYVAKVDKQFKAGIAALPQLTDLDDEEKNILITALYVLGKDIGTLTTQQNEYIAELCGCLEIRNITREGFSYKAIDSVTDLRAQKLMYQMVQEFIAIGGKEVSPQENQLLDMFQLNEATKNGIQKQVQDSLYMLGVSGLISRLQYSQENKVEMQGNVDATLHTESDDVDTASDDSTADLKVLVLAACSHIANENNKKYTCTREMDEMAGSIAGVAPECMDVQQRQ